MPAWKTAGPVAKRSLGRWPGTGYAISADMRWLSPKGATRHPCAARGDTPRMDRRIGNICEDGSRGGNMRKISAWPTFSLFAAGLLTATVDAAQPGRLI